MTTPTEILKGPRILELKDIQGEVLFAARDYVEATSNSIFLLIANRQVTREELAFAQSELKALEDFIRAKFPYRQGELKIDLGTRRNDTLDLCNQEALRHVFIQPLEHLLTMLGLEFVKNRDVKSVSLQESLLSDPHLAGNFNSISEETRRRLGLQS